jgi:hypothetical protein
VKQPGSAPKFSFLIVLLLTLAGFTLVLAPVAWATPRQNPHYQTIPTPVPTLAPAGPGEEPSGEFSATATPVSPAAATITPTLSATAAPPQPIAPTAPAEDTGTPAPVTETEPAIARTPTPVVPSQPSPRQEEGGVRAEGAEPTATLTSPSTGVAPFFSGATAGYYGLLGGALLIVIGLFLIYHRSGVG